MELESKDGWVLLGTTDILIQVLSISVCYLKYSADEPTDTDGAFTIELGLPQTFPSISGMNLYISTNADTATLAAIPLE